MVNVKLILTPTLTQTPESLSPTQPCTYVPTSPVGRTSPKASPVCETALCTEGPLARLFVSFVRSLFVSNKALAFAATLALALSAHRQPHPPYSLSSSPSYLSWPIISPLALPSSSTLFSSFYWFSPSPSSSSLPQIWNSRDSIR